MIGGIIVHGDGFDEWHSRQESFVPGTEMIVLERYPHRT